MSTVAGALGGKRPVALCERSQTKRPRVLPPHAAFFAAPKEARSLSANLSVDMAESFDDDLLPRVWTATDGKRRALTYLDMDAPNLEALLVHGGYGFLYGCNEAGQLDPAEVKLAKLGKGGFNQLWVGKMTPSSRRVLPPEIANLVQEDKVVIRAPLQTTESHTREDVVGEMTNVLHAALHGYGPLVAGMAWVRTWHRIGCEEGVMVVKYRPIHFMEKGGLSVWSRIKQVEKAGVPPVKHAFSSKQGIEQYFDALLRCIHAFSVDRFVYLDATLANFVDFCGSNPALPTRIKVIDIAANVFRRVLPPETATPSRAWQLLWLHNTLVVTCFLKRQLAGLSGLGGVSVARSPAAGMGSGQHAFEVHWWGKIRNAVAETRRLLEVTNGAFATVGANLDTLGASIDSPDDTELERCRAFLSKTQRSKDTPAADLWEFPQVDLPPYAGTSPYALAKSSLAYFYYYLVRQPLEDIQAVYRAPALKAAELRAQPHVHPKERAKAEEAHRKGANWFDAVARRALIPTLLFFHRRLADADGPDGGSALLVDIMAEYAATPQEVLEARFLGRVATSKQHALNDLHNLLPTLLAVARVGP